jgi:hypothetical protein
MRVACGQYEHWVPDPFSPRQVLPHLARLSFFLIEKIFLIEMSDEDKKIDA